MRETPSPVGRAAWSIMPSVFDYVEGALYLLLFISSLLVNIPLVMLLLRNRASRDDIVSMVMVSLSVSDIGHGTIAPGIGTVIAWMQPKQVPSWLVLVQGSARHIFMFNSVWHLALMSALKCYIIIRPLTFGSVLTERLRNVLIGALWTVIVAVIIGADLVGVRWTVDPLSNLAQPNGNPKMTTSFRNFESGLLMGVPSLVIFVAYVKILSVVRQHHVTIANQTIIKVDSDLPTMNNQGTWSASIKSARSLFFICIAFYITYIPSTVNNTGYALPDWYQIGTRWLLVNSSLANSLLYILLYKSTRKHFWQMFCGERCARHTGNSVVAFQMETNNKIGGVERF